ncbi:GntR family transcriptional regulator [Rhizohabitans arisaemae]|uniref:GntR family transcriptional regulator n=1 Tax=Rhizohabitans arisaemae TaxID=2720610 RepID=UPI0024B0AF5A|nr:GntR family transcriptional regulator [Rhizohabitans arisaemae]
MPSPDPVYLRVAADLRRQILDGTLPPGSPVPSRVQITQHYNVGQTAARNALRLLTSEGLIEGRVGSGHYVRKQPDLTRLNRNLYSHERSHFAAEVEALGVKPEWKTSIGTASPEIAQRLLIRPGDQVTRTRYAMIVNAECLALTYSYEPGIVTPENHESAGHGVIARMSADDVRIDSVVEEVHVRAPSNSEVEEMELRTGSQLLVIERTHFSGNRPVETADILLPSDRFVLRYRLPVDEK